MTDEQRKAVAIAYLKAIDGGGVTPDGRDILDRCFVYLDPDHAGRDTARHPWLA